MLKKIVLTRMDNFIKENYQNIYLSRGCFSYNFEKKYPNEQKKIIRYHWDNYEKLKKDKEYFNDLLDRIFPPLTNKLNLIQNKNLSIKFWEILIMHWLHSFIYINFDHWEMVNSLDFTEKNYCIDTLEFDEKEIIPRTLEDYIRLFGSDSWRHAMIKKILGYKFSKNDKKIDYVIEIKLKNDIKEIRNSIENYQNNLIKKGIINFYNKIFGFILKKQKFFIARSYLGKVKEFLLNISLFQLPTIFVPNIYSLSSEPDLRMRKEADLDFFPKNDFEKFLKDEIMIQLPISFLEGFNEIGKMIEKLSFPQAPKCIFVSNSHHKSLLTRLCANNVDNKCKIIHGQYGGSYGQWDMHWLEKYYKKISDVYLTWGWKDHENTHPLGILRPLGSKRNHKKECNKLLLIGKTIKSYGYSLDSNSGACQSDNYLKDCFLAINNLRDDIKKNLIVRLKPVGKGWNEKERFEDLLSKKIDDGKKPIFSVVKNAKIYFATYNGTGYLESLSMNIPTILFSNPFDEKLRNSCMEDFELLRKNKIFFTDPISATDHINQVWDDVNKWWYSENVQRAREKFCFKFSRTNSKILRDIKKIITKDLK